MNFKKEDIFICFILCSTITLIYIPLFNDAVYVDDALIYLRVVSNIINGNGWTYNINEISNPCSSIFYTIVLSFFAWLNNTLFSNLHYLSFLKLNLDKIPALVNIICINAMGLIHFVAFRKNKYEAFILSIVGATCGIFFVSSGMDCFLFIALILAGSLLFVNNSPWLSGIFAGLIALTRQEGFAYIFILIAFDLIYNRRFNWRMIASFVLVVSPWFMFSWVYFDSVLPNSVIIKKYAAGMAITFDRFSYLREFLKQPIYPYITYPLFIIGSIIIIKDSFTGRLYPMIVLSFGIVQTAGYTIMKASSGFFWYFAPGNFAVNMAMVIGLCRIIELLGKRINGYCQHMISNLSHIYTTLSKTKWLFAILIIVCMLRIGISPTKNIRPYRFAKDYMAVSKWITANTLPTDKVVCFEIGYVGFYSNREIRDPFGLIHPRALQEFKNGQTKWWYADRPEVIVTTNTPYPAFKQPLLDEFFLIYNHVFQSGNVNVWYKKSGNNS